MLMLQKLRQAIFGAKINGRHGKGKAWNLLSVSIRIRIILHSANYRSL